MLHMMQWSLPIKGAAVDQVYICCPPHGPHDFCFEGSNRSFRPLDHNHRYFWASSEGSSGLNRIELSSLSRGSYRLHGPQWGLVTLFYSIPSWHYAIIVKKPKIDVNSLFLTPAHEASHFEMIDLMLKKDDCWNKVLEPEAPLASSCRWHRMYIALDPQIALYRGQNVFEDK